MAETPYPSSEKKQRAAFLIDLGGDDDALELMAQLDKYRKLLGWSRKRVYLLGMAHIISNNGDNPDLVVRIANYLEK